MAFAQMLEMLMEKEGLSKYRLAIELGCHQSSVKNWLENITVPRVQAIEKLCERFGVSKEYILGETVQAKADYIIFQIDLLQIKKSVSSSYEEIEQINDEVMLLDAEYKELTGYYPGEKKEAPSVDGASAETEAAIEEIITLLSKLPADKLMEELYYLRRIAGAADIR